MAFSHYLFTHFFVLVSSSTLGANETGDKAPATQFSFLAGFHQAIWWRNMKPILSPFIIHKRPLECPHGSHTASQPCAITITDPLQLITPPLLFNDLTGIRRQSSSHAGFFLIYFSSCHCLFTQSGSEERRYLLYRPL